MTVGSLFSGIGGLDLGFEWAGFDVRWQCEQDKWCQRVLRRHWPETPIYDDVCELGKSIQPEPVDCLIGGFPCQNLSYAGKGAGLDGAKSGLWWEFHRIIGVFRPAYVVVENVPGLFTRGMDVVLGSLAEIGYDAEWEVVSAASQGAPHLRERVFIVAWRGVGNNPSPARQRGQSRQGQVESDSGAGLAVGVPTNGKPTDTQWSVPRGPYTDTAGDRADVADTPSERFEEGLQPQAGRRPRSDLGRQDVTNSEGQPGRDISEDVGHGSQRRRGSEASASRFDGAAADAQGVGSNDERRRDGCQINLRNGRVAIGGGVAPHPNGERLEEQHLPAFTGGQGHDTGIPDWAGGSRTQPPPVFEPGFRRVDDGLPLGLDRVARLRGLGNAVVPQVAYYVACHVRDFDQRRDETN